MTQASVNSLIERLLAGEAIALDEWESLPDLDTVFDHLGGPDKLSPQSIDRFSSEFRGTREYLSYLLHALGGIDAKPHGRPESIAKTLESLSEFQAFPASVRSRWVNRARAVSDAMSELLWLLLMELRSIDRPARLVDPTWRVAAPPTIPVPEGRRLEFRVVSFSVRGASYLLAGDRVKRARDEVDGTTMIQFGWTDEDATQIDWRDDPQDFPDAPEAGAVPSGPVRVRTFASIPEFYSLRMLEAVVMFRRGESGWDWKSVNGLSRDEWKLALKALTGSKQTASNYEGYYEVLRSRLLPNYPQTAPGDLLISLAFSVVPRALTAERSRHAATVFAKLSLHDLAGTGDATLTDDQIRRIGGGLWNRVNQLKLPLLRRLTADVIDTREEQSELLLAQQNLFDDLRVRMRDVAQSAALLEQRARELNLQISGSAFDMELPYKQVAQLFDDSRLLKSEYRTDAIPIRHETSQYSEVPDDAKWVLCAALSDLLGEPRETALKTNLPNERTTAWHFLSNPDVQLRLRIDLLIDKMKSGLWSADYIAGLLLNFKDDELLPRLPATETDYDRFRSDLLEAPMEALSRLKARFVDLGRIGRGRDLTLDVLPVLVPCTIDAMQQVDWSVPFCDSGAFTKASSLFAFLRTMYEKSTGARLVNRHPMRDDPHPLRVAERGRMTISRLDWVATAWRLAFPTTGNSLTIDLRGFVDGINEFRSRLQEPGKQTHINHQERGGDLGPFTDLVVAMDPRYRVKLVAETAGRNTVVLAVPHKDRIGREATLRIETSSDAIVLIQTIHS